MSKTKLVTIESPGKIAALGGILGPIKTPCRMDTDVIITLINSGKLVYEVNPSNVKEKVRLTRLNVLKNNFNESRVSISKSPVVKASDVGLSSVTVEPSGVNTTINRETGEGMIGTDIFVSNKRS